MNPGNIFSRRNRILLKELVVTDFKLRYQGSALGYVWSLLKPLLLFLILYIVFVQFLRFGAEIEHYPVYLLLGVVLWGFFTEATVQGMHAIVGRGDIIRKINFPKYIVVISSTISALINLLINLLVVLVFALINGVEFRASAPLFIFNLIELYILALAIAFLLSAVMVKYRDIGYLWEVFLQAAFYATPIIYPISLVATNSQTAAELLLTNPVAQIIQDARYNLISSETVTTGTFVSSPILATVPYAVILLLILIATYYFRRNAKHFAENI